MIATSRVVNGKRSGSVRAARPRAWGVASGAAEGVDGNAPIVVQMYDTAVPGGAKKNYNKRGDSPGARH